MMLRQRVTKYVQNVESALREVQINQTPMHLDEENVEAVIELVKLYLKDTKFYEEKGKFETALVSVAYCEGLLDALRLLGVVEFSWTEER